MGTATKERACDRCQRSFEVSVMNRSLSWRCSECQVAHKAEYHRRYNQDNAEKIARQRAEYGATPEAQRVRRDRSFVVNYGITLEEYEQRLLKQEFRCLLCGREHDEGGGRTGRLHVDHNHETGEVRGLLCARCNRTIGLADEDPDLLERMASYVR